MPDDSAAPTYVECPLPTRGGRRCTAHAIAEAQRLDAERTVQA